MTKTIDEQLERLATAQERTATALESILEAITNFKFEQVGNIAVAGVQAQEEPDAGTDHEASAEEAETQEAEVQEEDTSEPDPEPEKASDKSSEAVEEAGGEDGDESDPLGDGAPADDPYPLPEKLTTDTLRGFAREVMQKEGKSAVFEVLAAVGSGYKAVGEVSKDDLQQAHELMVERLRG